VATVFDGIDEKLATWLRAQPMFFVATAPLAGDGLVNCSPKGLLGTFDVLDERRVAYLDLTGSGIETIAHVRENGRIVLMFCAFDGRPRIVRLHGRGEAVMPSDPHFDELAGRFSVHPGTRAVVTIDVTRVADSCGFAVPRMTYVEDRDVLDLSAAKKGPEKMAAYRAARNSTSLDGLPGLPAHAPTPG